MTALILALMVLGLALMVAEAHLPTFGALGVAGVGSLAAGIVLAITAAGGSPALAVGITAPVAAGAVGLGAVAVRKAMSASRSRARCGAEGILGHVGIVRRPLDPLGQVAVDGELWRARVSLADDGEPPLREGEPVVVDRVHGLTLSVRRAEDWEIEP